MTLKRHAIRVLQLDKILVQDIHHLYDDLVSHLLDHLGGVLSVSPLLESAEGEAQGRVGVGVHRSFLRDKCSKTTLLFLIL